jgi:hypothetical protein
MKLLDVLGIILLFMMAIMIGTLFAQCTLANAENLTPISRIIDNQIAPKFDVLAYSPTTYKSK